MSGFDHEKMLAFSIKSIEDFAQKHREETFYGFSIDACLLCLNSEQAFERTLAAYRSRHLENYSTAADIESLRLNTGDWDYQGFADLTGSGGFDHPAYDQHYDASADEQSGTRYALAMDRLVDGLRASGVFEQLQRTTDFFANRVEHDY